MGDAAPPAEVSSKAENRSHSAIEKPTGQSAPRPSFGQEIKELFREAAKAIIETLAPSPAQRRKRREETERGFNLARALTARVTRSILHYLYRPSAYDPEQERADAEHVLRMQLDEWTQDGEQQQDEAFHYASAGGFDPQP
ncbi:MAG TPA: hypothetical protein VN822_06105 [Candidatus Acidoferrales bacterium]|nr:hypothetical protein [Candidatus Acidoferrales bacterium]